QKTIEFIKSRLRLVIKSAEYMLWYKQALKMMQQGKVNSIPALKKSDTEYGSTIPHSRKNSELGRACGKSVIQVTDIITSMPEQKSEK
ncbi:60S ribosomal protein L30, partial [Pelecanus crispus]